MTVAICMLNSKFIHSSLAPWCLSAGVKQYCGSGIIPVVTEGTVNEDIEAVKQRILGVNPQLIGFCCYIWNIGFVKALARQIKEETNAVIVFGGPEVSYNAEDILSEYEYVDYVLSGEGEEPFARLCSAVSENKDIDGISGLCFRKNGEIIISEPFISGKEPVSPYCAEYFDSLCGRIAYIETSRGCPFSCAFCLSGRCGGLVFYGLERVKKEILELAVSGAKTVKFVDRTFNAKPERANEIIEFIINKNKDGSIPDGVCFHFEIDGGTLREDTLELLCSAPAGLFQLEVGLQSFNSETLKAVRRNPDTTRLVKIIKRLLSAGNMHIHVDLIAGLPKEDLLSFEKSFDTLYAMKPHMLQLGFLKLLYGSALREKSGSFGCVYSDTAPYEVIKTDCLSESDMKIIHNAESALDRMYNSGRFRRTLDYLINICGISPFKLFTSLGGTTADKKNVSLDEFISEVFEFFSPVTDKSVLRDRMVCDRLASNSSGILPACLKIPDKKLKAIKKYVVEHFAKGKNGGKISVAILYSENKVVYCDYSSQNIITGEYELSYIDEILT